MMKRMPRLQRWRSLRLVLVLGAGLLAVPASILASTPAQAATCGQPAHVWWATPGGSLANGNTVNVANGTTVYLTGVVTPNTHILWHASPGTFSGPLLPTVPGVSSNGDTYYGTNADGNCVVHHQDNPLVVFTGTYTIYAQYLDPVNGFQANVLVGTITVS